MSVTRWWQRELEGFRTVAARVVAVSAVHLVVGLLVVEAADC